MTHPSVQLLAAILLMKHLKDQCLVRAGVGTAGDSNTPCAPRTYTAVLGGTRSTQRDNMEDTGFCLFPHSI